MTPAIYRAFRFVHPDFAPGGAMPGLHLAPNCTMEMVEGDDSVRQAILLLLTTRPGERVMRPEYGSELHQLVFAPNDDTTAGLAIFYVRRALERWEPRIEVARLDAERNSNDPSRLDIMLEYRVRATQQPQTLQLSLSLTGEGT